jgi:hypothetical protein
LKINDEFAPGGAPYDAIQEYLEACSHTNVEIKYHIINKDNIEKILPNKTIYKICVD